jgi:hypothetical protein
MLKSSGCSKCGTLQSKSRSVHINCLSQSQATSLLLTPCCNLGALPPVKPGLRATC